MMGLATQSARWKTSMQYHLEQVAKKTAEATAWQEAEVEDQSASEELQQAAVQAEERGAALQEESNVLYAKAEADQAKATTAEERADGLAEDAAVKQGEVDALTGEAMTEETVAEEDTAKAVADSALSAEDTTIAQGDEVATGWCQAIPFVDIVCDVVGGIAAAGLETQAVRSGARAAEEYAAAAAAQMRVDAVAQEAEALEATATEELADETSLQADAAAMEAEAEADFSESALEEETAEEQFAQGAEDEAASEGEAMKAVGEEEAAGKAWAESTKHGVLACQDALIMMVMSTIIGLFFVARIAASFVLPAIVSGIQYAWTWLLRTIQAPTQPKTTRNIVFTNNSPETLVTISHAFHHGLLFIVFFGVWGNYLLQLRQLASIKAMGEIIILFSLSLAATQSLLLHSLPKVLTYQHNSGSSWLWVGVREFGRRFVVFLPLVVMELLLVWVNFGKWLFATAIVTAAQQWYFWSILATTLLAHYFVVHYLCLLRDNDNHRCNAEDPSTQHLLSDANQGPPTNTYYGSNLIELLEERRNIIELLEERKITENVNDVADPMWEAIDREEWSHGEEHGTENASSHLIVAPQQETQLWFHEEVWQDIKMLRLVLVFEVLMACVMLALIQQASPTLWKLWPASKAVLLSSLPRWQIVATCVGIAALTVVVCGCL